MTVTLLREPGAMGHVIRVPQGREYLGQQALEEVMTEEEQTIQSLN